MEDIKGLRKLLKDKNASWSIPEDYGAKLADKAPPIYEMGSLPLPPGMMTSKNARMRKDVEGEYRIWQSGVLPLMREISRSLPKSWDWRNVNGKDWIHPSRNQGGCGSCVSFATAGALESHWKIQGGNAGLNVDISEAAMFFVNNRQCNPTDPNYGWWIASALDFLIVEGACFEQNYPYIPVNQTANLVDGTELTYKIRGYDSTTSRDLMKRWLAEEGPLIADFSVYEDFMTYWNAGANGCYSHITGKLKGGHAVLVVGYDDNQSCWICKNSWTPGPSNDGCFRIAYGQCGIDDRMYLMQDIYRVFTIDELPYDPKKLRIVDEGPSGWLLTDGISRMKIFDNKEDARNGLMVARRHNRHGFIGRDNNRGAKRMDYITEYWAGDSGLPYESLTKTDCIPYNPQNVVAQDLDQDGWRLREGNHWMLMAHDVNDALAVLRLIERNTRMCFIGRDNKRPNRKSYIMTYWE